MNQKPGGEWDGEVLPLMAYTEGSAWNGYLFQASGIYRRIGILLVEVYERVGKSVILVFTRT